MKVVITCTGISRVANVGNYISLVDVVSNSNSFGIALQVGVIKDQFFVRAQLVNSSSSLLTRKELDNLPVSSREYWSSSRRWDIDRIVHPAFRPRIIESVNQLFRPHAGNGHN